MPKRIESGPSKQEQERISETRNAAEITLGRVKSYEELLPVKRRIKGKEVFKPGTREQGEKKFEEVTKKLLEDLVVHGMYGKPVSDLDGECSLTLLRLAGVDTSKIKYVEKGKEIKGKVNIDTGNKHGLVVEEETRTAWLDHHGKESGNNTSATKIVYETLINLGLLDPNDFLGKDKKNYLEKVVKFVTQIDNKTYPRKMEDFKKSYKTSFGLGKFIKPELLIRFFKEGGNPLKDLSDTDIKKMQMAKKSRNLKDNIRKSIERLGQMKDQGLIINSRAYGNIAIDLGGKIPCSDDAATAYGCNGYIKWSPPNFFFSTAKKLKPEHIDPEWEDQGIINVRDIMLMKPQHDTRPLKVTLGELLSKLTDEKLKPKRELEKYLDEEIKKIDLSSTGGKIKEKEIPKSKIMRKTEQAPKEEQENLEIAENPFQEMEREEIESLTHGYAEKTQIDPDTKKAVNVFLVKEGEELYREFAEAWFHDHAAEMGPENIIPPGSSEDFIINKVLTLKEVRAEINKSPEKIDARYRAIREKMDRVKILRTDMARAEIPPETPFLLLNHMQASADKIKGDIKKLRDRESNGDINAGFEANSKEEKLEELNSNMREIAGEVMGEDLRKNAEEAIKKESPNWTKENYVGEHIDARERDIAGNENQRLIEREWGVFSSPRLTDAQRRDYKKEMEYSERMTIDDFIINSSSLNLRPEATQAIQSHNNIQIKKEYDRYNFMLNMTEHASKFGSGQPEESEKSFYGLLKKGYKPHLTTRGKVGWPWFRKEVINIKGAAKPMSIAEFDDLTQRAGDEYSQNIRSQTTNALEAEWDNKNEGKIDGKIEERIRTLSSSPEGTGIDLGDIYKRARDRRVDEYISKEVKKNPKTTAEVAAVEKMFKKAGKKIDINKFMGDVLLERGELANLDEAQDEAQADKVIAFLQGLGIDQEIATEVVLSHISGEDFIATRNKQKSFFDLMFNAVQKAFELMAVEKKEEVDNKPENQPEPETSEKPEKKPRKKRNPKPKPNPNPRRKPGSKPKPRPARPKAKKNSK